MYKKYNEGFIEVFTGCMFAGKTQELIRVISTLRYTNKKIITFKLKIDNRYSENEIASHFGSRVEAICIENSKDILKNNIDSYDIVAIDEVQFLDEGIIKIIKDLANKGKRVLIAGLDQDFRGEPFGPMPKILAIAEFVTKLSAICHICGNSATRTQRIINNKPAKRSSPLILVGATEEYQARCRLHHEVL